MARAALHFGRCGAAFGDDLVETAIELDSASETRSVERSSPSSLGAWRLPAPAQVCATRSLTREIVETFVDGGKLIARSVFVVLVIPDRFASLPHAFFDR